METKQITPHEITYSNSFEFNGRLLAFRKKELFDITDMPKYIPFNGHWNVGRVQLSKSKAKDLLTNKPVTKDITNLSWYIQESLNHVLTEYL